MAAKAARTETAMLLLTMPAPLEKGVMGGLMGELGAPLCRCVSDCFVTGKGAVKTHVPDGEAVPAVPVGPAVPTGEPG